MNNLERNTEQVITQQYIQKLQPGDLLTIQVSTIDNVGVAPFNLITQNSEISDSPTGRQKLVTYNIRPDGTIEFPVLGIIKLKGLTTIEATDLLKQKLKKYLKEPIVTLEWLNFKFTVLGQVNRPGVFSVQGERMSFFEALGMAGDLDIYGSRKDVLLIRENNGMQQMISIDLTQKDILTSDAYYIKQNDVIIVSPNQAQVQASAFNRNIPTYISVTSVIISVIVLLTR